MNRDSISILNLESHSLRTNTLYNFPAAKSLASTLRDCSRHAGKISMGLSMYACFCLLG